MCAVCRHMYCDMSIDLNHHDSVTEHYLNNNDIVICANCLYSYKRINKFIIKGIINNDELSGIDKYI